MGFQTCFPSRSPILTLNSGVLRSPRIHLHPPYRKWRCSDVSRRPLKFSMTRVRFCRIRLWETGALVSVTGPSTILTRIPQLQELPFPLPSQVRNVFTLGCAASYRYRDEHRDSSVALWWSAYHRQRRSRNNLLSNCRLPSRRHFW